jgi:predicted metal-binding protein
MEKQRDIIFNFLDNRNNQEIINLLHSLNIDVFQDIDPRVLIPEQRIIGFCINNACGNYGTRYTCPPLNGSLEDFIQKLKQYKYGILVQYSKSIILKGNTGGVRETLFDFHNKILMIEDFLTGKGFKSIWGLIGGTCLLCEQCGAKTGEPCRHPDKARPSLEAIGIDVLTLLDKLGLDNKFHKDKITWTGCVLIGDRAK